MLQRLAHRLAGLASQTRAVLSSDAVTTRLPSALKLAELDLAFMLERLAHRLAGLGIPDARGLVV